MCSVIVYISFINIFTSCFRNNQYINTSTQACTKACKDGIIDTLITGFNVFYTKREEGLNKSNMSFMKSIRHCSKLINKNIPSKLFLRCASNSIIYPATPSASGFNNYEEECQNHKIEVPEYFNFVKDVLEQWHVKESEGLRNSSNPAFWWVDDHNNELQWSFGDMLEEANRVSNVLSEICQIKKGDRVIVILPRVPEWWLINIACLKMGAILSPGTISLTANDILKRVNNSEAVTVITIPELVDAVDQVHAQCPSLKTKLVVGTDEKQLQSGWLPLKTLMKQASKEYECFKTKSTDPMSWFFTSGTTGLPKMAEHTQVSYGLAHIDTGKYWLDLVESDIMWNLSDTGWAKSAYSSFYAPWWQGSTVFVHHTPKFDPRKTIDILRHFPVSVTCLPPTAYRMMVLEDLEEQKFMNLRHCVSAGEPLNPEVTQNWFEKTGLVIREGYGQTEMTVSCATFPCMQVKPGSMGKPAPGYDVRILGNDGKEVGADIEGEMAVKCKPDRPVGLFTQYVKDEERTAKAFYKDYYLTGDRAKKDEDGYIWFVGRSDDVIISSGYRIGPFEVESALIEHPAVAESAVVSSPCDTRGEVVKAFIILTPGYLDKDQIKLTMELQDHCKQFTAPYKYPRRIEFVETLPKTISGKIRRVELREAEWENYTQA